jgi:hypothetical protein
MEGTKDFWVLCISLSLSLITFVVILIRMGTQVGDSLHLHPDCLARLRRAVDGAWPVAPALSQACGKQAGRVAANAPRQPPA